jgi:hypothetical protein
MCRPDHMAPAGRRSLAVRHRCPAKRPALMRGSTPHASVGTGRPWGRRIPGLATGRLAAETPSANDCAHRNGSSCRDLPRGNMISNFTCISCRPPMKGGPCERHGASERTRCAGKEGVLPDQFPCWPDTRRLRRPLDCRISADAGLFSKWRGTPAVHAAPRTATPVVHGTTEANSLREQKLTTAATSQRKR